MRVELLIIDPQNDFCKPGGALYVPNAETDIDRLSKMVKRLGKKIDAIHVTLDSHHYIDIAHPSWWRNSNGDEPTPFTIISSKDMENGIWTTKQPGLFKRTLQYLKDLEGSNRYPLCIWPPHCLIGSEGNCVAPTLFQELLNWENNFRMVNYVTKGSNPYTEHYSAVQAEVPDPNDPTTQVNAELIQRLMQADVLAVAGEAGSHCVANTVRDIAATSGSNDILKKVVILEDAMSPVPGFEQNQADFFAEMKAAGAQFSTTTDFLK